MSTRLAEIHENAGKYIVPSSATDKEPPVFRCFDPNDCHCTTYAGGENVLGVGMRPMAAGNDEMH